MSPEKFPPKNNTENDDTKLQSKPVDLFSWNVLSTTLIMTSSILGGIYFYKNYVRRIPNSSHIPQSYFKNRNLLGVVTSVGDGDNFHFFHTPGGILMGWGWLRTIPPISKGQTKGRKLGSKAIYGFKKPGIKQTIHVRLNGVDAPENAHFGRPAQPYSTEALQWLRSMILGRRVRFFPLTTDQYGRTVGEVIIRGKRWFNFFRKFNVSAEMLKNGWATVYEAKTGAEFNGHKELFINLEKEAKRKRKGIFVQKNLETPREYKEKYRNTKQK